MIEAEAREALSRQLNKRRMRQTQHKQYSTMGDSNSSGKKPGVPSWQLQSKPTDTEEAQQAPESSSRQTMIEQAKKFLEEDEVRNASTDKKIAFLESKGLKSEEITELLGVTRNPEASAAPPSQVRPQVPPRSQYRP